MPLARGREAQRRGGHGDFEKFRDTLKEYIQSSLYAATGKEVETKLKVGAA